MKFEELKRKLTRFFVEQVDWVERFLVDFIGGTGTAGVVSEGLAYIVVGVAWFGALFFLYWVVKKIV